MSRRALTFQNSTIMNTGVDALEDDLNKLSQEVSYISSLATILTKYNLPITDKDTEIIDYQNCVNIIGNLLINYQKDMDNYIKSLIRVNKDKLINRLFNYPSIYTIPKDACYGIFGDFSIIINKDLKDDTIMNEDMVNVIAISCKKQNYVEDNTEEMLVDIKDRKLTTRYITVKGDTYILEPPNPNYPKEIVKKEDCKILAKVISQMRNVGVKDF